MNWEIEDVSYKNKENENKKEWTGMAMDLLQETRPWQTISLVD
jgi:hypothetical protein